MIQLNLLKTNWWYFFLYPVHSDMLIGEILCRNVLRVYHHYFWGFFIEYFTAKFCLYLYSIYFYVRLKEHLFQLEI